jgi:hypothetical protein
MTLNRRHFFAALLTALAPLWSRRGAGTPPPAASRPRDLVSLPGPASDLPGQGRGSAASSPRVPVDYLGYAFVTGTTFSLDFPGSAPL